MRVVVEQDLTIPAARRENTALVVANRDDGHEPSGAIGSRCRERNQFRAWSTVEMKQIDSAVDLAVGISNGGAYRVNEPVCVCLSDLARCIDKCEVMVGEFTQLHGWMLEMSCDLVRNFEPPDRAEVALFDEPPNLGASAIGDQRASQRDGGPRPGVSGHRWDSEPTSIGGTSPPGSPVNRKPSAPLWLSALAGLASTR